MSDGDSALGVVAGANCADIWDAGAGWDGEGVMSGDKGSVALGVSVCVSPVSPPLSPSKQETDAPVLS